MMTIIKTLALDGLGLLCGLLVLALAIVERVTGKKILPDLD